MSDLWNKLAGKKTYLISLGLALLAAIFRLDTLLHDNLATDVVETAWLSVATYEAIGMALGGGGLAAIRAGVSK